MPLQLQEIDKDTDFPALARCLFEAHEDPPQKFFHVFFPILGSNTEAREAAINEGAERLKLWHTEDPTSSWRKVVDTETGQIAGAATWNTHLDNPYPLGKAELPDAYWLPDDGSRKWAEEALIQFEAPRIKHASKPHQCKKFFALYC